MPRIPTTEDRRLEEARIRKKHWKRWGPIFRNASGAQSVKITVPTAPLGNFSLMTTPARAPTVGAKTALAESAIATR